METKTVALEDIQPAPYNPRKELTDNDPEFVALKKSIDQFGLVVPLIINKQTGNLISGHQRLNALKNQGATEAEAVMVDLEPEKEKALCIAMNKIEGEWDYGKLSELLEELGNNNIDLQITGMTSDEINELIGELQHEADSEEMPEVERQEKQIVETGTVKCIVGEYRFTIPRKEYEDIIADIRLEVGFAKIDVETEMKRRLLA